MTNLMCNIAFVNNTVEKTLATSSVCCACGEDPNLIYTFTEIEKKNSYVMFYSFYIVLLSYFLHHQSIVNCCKTMIYSVTLCGKSFLILLKEKAHFINGTWLVLFVRTYWPGKELLLTQSVIKAKWLSVLPLQSYSTEHFSITTISFWMSILIS